MDKPLPQVNSSLPAWESADFHRHMYRLADVQACIDQLLSRDHSLLGIVNLGGLTKILAITADFVRTEEGKEPVRKLDGIATSLFKEYSEHKGRKFLMGKLIDGIKADLRNPSTLTAALYKVYQENPAKFLGLESK